MPRNGFNDSHLRGHRDSSDRGRRRGSRCLQDDKEEEDAQEATRIGGSRDGRGGGRGFSQGSHVRRIRAEDEVGNGFGIGQTGVVSQRSRTASPTRFKKTRGSQDDLGNSGDANGTYVHTSSGESKNLSGRLAGQDGDRERNFTMRCVEAMKGSETVEKFHIPKPTGSVAKKLQSKQKPKSAEAATGVRKNDRGGHGGGYSLRGRKTSPIQGFVGFKNDIGDKLQSKQGTMGAAAKTSIGKDDRSDRDGGCEVEEHGRARARHYLADFNNANEGDLQTKQKPLDSVAGTGVGKIDGGVEDSRSHPRSAGPRSRDSQGNITLGVLKSWSENKNSVEVLIQASNQIEAVEKLLMSDALDEEWYEHLVHVFAATMTCHAQSIKLKRLLQVLSASHFLTHLLTNYLDTKEHYGLDWTDAEEFFKSILKIVQQIVKHRPESASNCKSALRCLHSMVKIIRPACKHQEVQDSIVKVLTLATETHRTWVTRQRDGSFYRPNTDSETPPENFQDMSVIPTAADLSPDAKPFVRAVITKGVYKDQQHYLDIQFRLMREDFIKPLRNGIQKYRDHGQDKKLKGTDRDIRLYHNVHFTGMTHTQGINHVIQFDVSSMRHVKWDHSKRLLNGNLLCLSNDNFESTNVFATVSVRESEWLKRGIVHIECLSGLDIVLKASPMDTFVMAETMAYYEAVHPILKGLQTIESDLPLKDYIILGQKRLKPPAYLLEKVREYDIGCMMKDSKTTEIPVLNPLKWPPSEKMCLNPSQREAAILALTKEMSLIQGPPGTGKTYVGLKIMQVLLENQDRMMANTKGDTDPILVICYTNHALDQFLEGILQFCPKGIIRVGGKSSSHLLERFNLKNVKRNFPNSVIIDSRDDLKEYSSKIKAIKRRLDSLTTDVLSEEVLSNCIASKHFDSLQVIPNEINRKSKIHQWLNAPSQSLLEALSSMIKVHMTNLVMKCLKRIKMGDPNLSLKSQQPIIERVKLYRCWLVEYQQNLTTKISYGHGSDTKTKNDLSLLYHRSNRPSILNDSEIGYVIPPKYFRSIKMLLGNGCSVFEKSHQVIEAWVLGLQNGCSKQLDDVDKLSRFIKRGGRPEDDDGDGFDDEEESKNAIEQRQYFEDDEDERKCFDATLKVVNDGSFLLHRAKSLGISENQPATKDILRDNGFYRWRNRKPYTFSQVERFLSDERHLPKSEDEEKTIEDVWSLTIRDRFALYRLWIHRYKESLVRNLESLIEQFSTIKQKISEARMKEDVDVMKRAKVIGMTTTGAAKKMAWLEDIGCRIIVVEEAAEVLEAHIVTALNKNCQHLILIGDHKQLRPNPTVYEHAIRFGLDVSLFERLVNNDIPHVTLSEQHRMRESISVVMRHIYPNLQDHASVRRYKNVQGVSKNIFFIQHDHDEAVVKDSHSKSNPFEAEYLVRLCKYFLLQGYQGSQITILATYGGQVLALKKEMSEYNFTDQQQVRVSTVDNFQGEENDIILLSLVRSNKQNTAGFLKVDNRVCVALSRAKKGMFVIGNLALLASQSVLWKKIKTTADQEGTTGDGLPISCPNHNDEKNVIKVPGDFDCSPEGGCKKKCDFRLDCGHICRLTCHGYDLKHKKVMCYAPCNKSCPEGHPCPKLCFTDCGDCTVKVLKEIKACGHTNEFLCSVSPEDTDCYSHCETVLSCGHRCVGICGICKENYKHSKCEVPMTYSWPCGHRVEVPCYFKPSENPCPKPCKEVLRCGHECPGKCFECLKGAVHVACSVKCDKTLICGHMCQGVCGAPCPPCSRPCPVSCRHGPCPNTCGELCRPCQEPCYNKCPHRRCSRKCHETCDVQPCDMRCLTILEKCGHRCSAPCGEICVCVLCHKVSTCKKLQSNTDKSEPKQTESGGALLLKIPSCGHIFKLDEIDEYIKTDSRKLSTEFISCPTCLTPVQECNRYERVLKKNMKRRENKKVKPRYCMSAACDVIFDLSVTRLRNLDTEGNFEAWWYLNGRLLSSSQEVLIVSSKLKIAYGISVIQSLYKERGVSSTERGVVGILTRLLKAKQYMPLQQIEECTMELKRLLLIRYSRLLITFADKHGLELPDDLVHECVSVTKSLMAVKPASDVMESAMKVVTVLEDSIIGNICSDPTAQDELQCRREHARETFDILNSENSEMLVEAIYSAKEARTNHAKPTDDV